MPQVSPERGEVVGRDQAVRGYIHGLGPVPATASKYVNNRDDDAISDLGALLPLPRFLAARHRESGEDLRISRPSHSPCVSCPRLLYSKSYWDTRQHSYNTPTDPQTAKGWDQER